MIPDSCAKGDCILYSKTSQRTCGYRCGLWRPEPADLEDNQVVSGPYSITTDVWPGLAKAMEEAGEFLQAIGKIMSVGGSLEYYDGTDLALRLEDEAADLYAALDFLCEANHLYARESERRDQKRARLRNWHAGISRSLSV